MSYCKYLLFAEKKLAESGFISCAILHHNSCVKIIHTEDKWLKEKKERVDMVKSRIESKKTLQAATTAKCVLFFYFIVSEAVWMRAVKAEKNYQGIILLLILPSCKASVDENFRFWYL
jgi:hypothetical protein